MPRPRKRREAKIPAAVLKALGRFVVNYSRLDATLRWLGAALLGSSEDQLVAMVKMSHRALVETVDALYVQNQPPIAVKEWRGFIKRVGALAERRNAMMHSAWFEPIAGLGAARISSRLRQGQGLLLMAHDESLESVAAAAKEAHELESLAYDMLEAIEASS